MIVLYVLGYFNRNKQNSYAALRFNIYQDFSLFYHYSGIHIKNRILGGSYGVTHSLFMWKVLTILT